jgi:hypothetical protein
VTLSVKEKMLSYNKAQKLAETWVELTTEGACEISQVEDINLMAGSSIFLSGGWTPLIGQPEHGYKL